MQFNLKVKRFKCVNNKYIVSLIAKKISFLLQYSSEPFLYQVSALLPNYRIQIFLSPLSQTKEWIGGGRGVAILPNRRRLMLNAAQTPDLDASASVIFLRRYFLGRYVRKDHKQCVTFSTGD